MMTTSKKVSTPASPPLSKGINPGRPSPVKKTSDGNIVLGIWLRAGRYNLLPHLPIPIPTNPVLELEEVVGVEERE